MARLKPGVKAPEFTLETGSGVTVSLKDFAGKKVVLYFYPKDDTPGCTREACSFQDNILKIKRKGAVVIGVSPDTPGSHEKFATKYGLRFPLLSDPDKKLVRAYGVWKKKSFMGRTYMGVERTTFIVDEAGVITHIFPRVKVDGHTEEVLASL
jgi:peroxiredoxin Q/BCP